MGISVIIPHKNEADSIALLLDSLLGQTLTPDEIIIVDSGSTDASVSILRSYAASHPSIKLIQETNSLPGKSRNIAIAHAAQDIIAMIDAGCIPEHNWLAELVRPFENPSVDIVWGVFTPLVRNLFHKCYAIVAIAPYGSIINGKKFRSKSFVSCAVRKPAWQTLGGFDETLRASEDVLIRKKIDLSSLKVVFSPNALVHWVVNPTFTGSLRKIFIYTYYRVLAGAHTTYLFNIFVFYFLLFILFLHHTYFTLSLYMLAGYILYASTKKIIPYAREWGKDFNWLLCVCVPGYLLLKDTAQNLGFLYGQGLKLWRRANKK